MTTRGIFLLENIRSRQREGDWVPFPSVFGKDNLQDVGYVVGGKNSSNASVSNYQSITYNSDTIANIANLPYIRRGVYGTASPTTGYAMGGYKQYVGTPSDEFNSNVSKLTLATQTHAELPGVNMSAGYGKGGSCGNATAGYICGGWSTSEPGGYTRLEKITYSTETMERIPSSNLPGYPSGNYNNAASGNGDLFGLFVGGTAGSGTKVAKLTYATDQWTTSSSWNLPGSPSLNRMQKAGMASSDTGAYVVGGSNPYNSRIQKISFSNLTSSIVTNSSIPTSNGRFHLTGTGNPSFGYFAGGTETSIVEKMNFSTNSISRLPALNLSQGLSDTGSLSSTADNKEVPKAYRIVDGQKAGIGHGFSVSGRDTPGSFNSSAYKITFATETATRTPSADNSHSVEFAAGAGNSTEGYMAGGTDQSPGSGEEWLARITYATDTKTDMASGFGARRYGCFSFTNGDTSMFAIGGRPDSPQNFIRKLTYGDSSFATVPGSGANLSAGRYNGSSFGTQTVGYMATGSTYDPMYSNVDKFTFATETTVRAPGANVPHALRMSRGLSASTKGYIVGGHQLPGLNGGSQIQTVTYSTDTAAMAPSTLLQSKVAANTLGTDENGYIVGGYPLPSGPYQSSINKLEYSTETVTAGFNSPGLQGKGVGLSAGNQNLPYVSAPTPTPTPTLAPGPSFDGAFWMGGYNNLPAGGQLSNGGKLTFSTNTMTLTPGVNLISGRYNLAAIGSSKAGYFGQSQVSNITKADFSTDTSSVLADTISVGTGGPGNDARRRGATFGNLDKGYFMNGSTGNSGSLSNMDKITYATDTISPKTDSPVATYATSGVANLINGYLHGGAAGNSTYKFTFESESWASAPGASFPGGGIWDGSTFGNDIDGFFLGGTGNGQGSRVMRLTYSSDSSSRIPGSNVPFRTSYGWTSGNGDYGYLSGGSSGDGRKSTIYRFTYSNDTWDALPSSADMSNPSRQGAAAGARSYNKGTSAPNSVPIVL